MSNTADIERNIAAVRVRIARACERSGRSPDSVTLVAVTKTVGPTLVRAAFEAGIGHFGENRVQEAEEKLASLRDIRAESTWHMIGHLQTNKAKTALGVFDIIQSIDSLKLAEFISRSAGRTVPILLEVNAAGEATKGGFPPGEIGEALAKIREMPRLDVQGLMTIVPLVSDPEEARPVFRRIRELRDILGLPVLSMGMSDDFEVAIEEGATLIRVGRAIFGERRV